MSPVAGASPLWFVPKVYECCKVSTNIPTPRIRFRSVDAPCTTECFRRCCNRTAKCNNAETVVTFARAVYTLTSIVIHAFFFQRKPYAFTEGAPSSFVIKNPIVR